MTSRCAFIAPLLLAALYVQATDAGSASLQSSGSSISYHQHSRTASFGSLIGATGIWPVDVDSDGVQELVLSGEFDFSRASFWSIADFNAQTGAYEIRWQSPRSLPDGSAGWLISALHVVQVGSTARTWVGRIDGTIDVVNLLTRETLQTLAPEGNPINDFAVADVDNDGALDVAAITDTHTYLYDPTTLTQKRVIQRGGRRIQCGNVDDDANLETVFDTGVVLEVTAAAATVQWTAPLPFGLRLQVADIDGDQRAEVVASNAVTAVIRAWDVDTQSPKWTFTGDDPVSAMRVLDVVGDPTPEIVFGDTTPLGSVHVLDAATRSEILEIPNPDYDVTDFAVLDVDGDGSRELVWGAGASWTGGDFLYVYDLSSRTVEWQSHDYFGAYEGVKIGDVDGDGSLEIVAATHNAPTDNGFDRGKVVVLDADTLALKWSVDISDGIPPFVGLHGVELTNLDSDPQLEILVASDSFNAGALYIIDGLTHELQPPVVLEPGIILALSQITRADLDGDGQGELIAGTWTFNNISPGAFVYALDPATYDILWKSPALPNSYPDPAGGGFERSDHTSDLVVADVGPAGMDVVSVSARVHAVRWSDKRVVDSVGTDYLSVAVADVSSDTGAEILASTKQGKIDVLNGDTLAVGATHDVCTGPINALRVLSGTRVVATCNDRLVVYDLAALSVVDETVSSANRLGLNASIAQMVVDGRSTVVVGGDEIVTFVDGAGNDAPTISFPPMATVHWRASSVDLQLAATDPDQDALRFELIALPLTGTATWLDASTGRLRYTPKAGAALGLDSMMVRAFDGFHYSSPQEFAVTLTNTGPAAGNSEFSLSSSSVISSQLPATDADGDPLQYSIVQQPTEGTLTLNAATGAFNYTPAALGAARTVSVTFRVDDGKATAQGSLAFVYAAVSAPPPSSPGGGGGGGGGGSSGPLLLALLAGLYFLRRELTRPALRVRSTASLDR